MEDTKVPKTLTIDLETSGLDWQRDKIYLIGYRINSHGDVVQIPPHDYQQDETFRQLLADPKVTKRGHNIKFDLHFLRSNGYVVNGPMDDTSILSYLEDPFRSTSLKDLVEQKLGKKVVRMEDFAIRPKKKELQNYTGNSQFYQVDKDFYPKEKMLEYHKADVINCDQLRADVRATDWYKNVEQPLLGIIFNMEHRGIQLDIPHFKRLKEKYELALQEITERVGGINIRSSDQLAEYIKKNGGKLSEKTEKGKLKVDKLILKRLLWSGAEYARPLLEYRKLSKLLSTYVNPLLEQSDATGRIHGSFNQAGSESSPGESSGGTKTGRLTSSGPNLQNIPDRTEEGKEIRRGFIPTKGYILGDSDLKQIEPRLVAHYTQNKFLLNAYEKGLDTHAVMGGIIFNKSPESLTKMERFTGKTSWLADFYGCSAPKLKIISETYSDEALPASYDERYYANVKQALERGNPQLYSWRREHIQTTRALGYITTIGGRNIKIPGLNSKDRFERFAAERQAVNYLIQGSAADIMKLILVRLDKEFIQKGYGHILGTIHDEVLFEFEDNLLDHINLRVIDIVRDVMTSTVKLKNVPIDSDTKIIKDWSEK